MGLKIAAPCLSRAVKALFIGAVALAAMAATAAGQEFPRRAYEEQLRSQIDEQSAASRRMGLDGGAWANFNFYDYDDGQKNRVLRQYDVRPWASYDVQDVHRIYVRGITGWDDWNSGTNPSGTRDDRYRQPKLERGWYQFDIGRAIARQSKDAPPLGLKFKVGREFTTIGTGLVLAVPLDMVQGDMQYGDWRLKAILGKSITHTPNPVDNSPAVRDHQDRGIWGFEGSYTGFTNHRPFAYFLANDDNTDAWGDDSAQAYEYSSKYIGGGSMGSLVCPDLHYQTELVGEIGQTYSEGVTSGRDEIRAMAYDLLLEYYFRAPLKPKVMGEYLFASGDPGRRTSSTATLGGNNAGSIDHAFNAFGFRDTGLSEAPAISNLHMYVTGASFQPLESFKRINKLEVGAKVFLYQKASSGPISDPEADDGGRWVGWEWDLFADWRITSDLFWTVRYGQFQPGETYDDHDGHPFLFTGVAFNF